MKRVNRSHKIDHKFCLAHVFVFVWPRQNNKLIGKLSVEIGGHIEYRFQFKFVSKNCARKPSDNEHDVKWNDKLKPNLKNWANLPLSMWTRTETGLALDGAHVYLRNVKSIKYMWLAHASNKIAGQNIESHLWEKCTYIPESLWMAFCTSRRLVVRRPFSVTNDMPPRGESKFITFWSNKNKQNAMN